MLLTPQLFTKGFFTFKEPWAEKVNKKKGVVFEVIAIRAFEDLYKLGEDVYEKYYVPVGITNGTSIDGVVFNFSDEVIAKPSIITFSGSDGSLMYVPNTFIKSIPTETSVPYSEIVLAISLGPLPDYLDITTQLKDIEDYVNTKMNIRTKVIRGALPLTVNPTFEEHAVLEQTRLGASIFKPVIPKEDVEEERETVVEDMNNPTIFIEELPDTSSTQMLLEEALKTITLRDETIQTLLNILDDNGLVASISE